MLESAWVDTDHTEDAAWRLQLRLALQDLRQERYIPPAWQNWPALVWSFFVLAMATERPVWVCVIFTGLCLSAWLLLTRIRSRRIQRYLARARLVERTSAGRDSFLALLVEHKLCHANQDVSQMDVAAALAQLCETNTLIAKEQEESPWSHELYGCTLYVGFIIACVLVAVGAVLLVSHVFHTGIGEPAKWSILIVTWVVWVAVWVNLALDPTLAFIKRAYLSPLVRDFGLPETVQNLRQSYLSTRFRLTAVFWLAGLSGSLLVWLILGAALAPAVFPAGVILLLAACPLLWAALDRYLLGRGIRAALGLDRLPLLVAGPGAAFTPPAWQQPPALYELRQFTARFPAYLPPAWRTAARRRVACVAAAQAACMLLVGAAAWSQLTDSPPGLLRYALATVLSALHLALMLILAHRTEPYAALIDYFKRWI